VEGLLGYVAPVEVYKLFGETYCLYLQGQINDTQPVKDQNKRNESRRIRLTRERRRIKRSETEEQ
jgi:hypothetical protein